MKKILFMGSFFLVGFALLLTGAIAQDIEYEDFGKFAYGIVVDVSADSITLSEYDLDSESDRDVKYVINGKTQYRNLESYKDIEIGDEVDIDYIEVNGDKFATLISKDNSGIAEDIDGDKNWWDNLNEFNEEDSTAESFEYQDEG